MYTTNPKVSASLALASLVYQFIFPQPSLMENNLTEEIQLAPVDQLATLQDQALIQTANPDTPIVIARQWVIVTGYSSTPDQTDATPFITASGTQVRDGIVACNFLRFGTRVRFPQLYGDKIFVVEDRMAPKNSHKMDIWFASREQAKQFGVKPLKIEVLEI
jgi:3D (Asp-Asp-Asp) domain-containing protein